MNIQSISNLSERAQAFVARTTDNIWAIAERALDNGFGFVFLSDQQGQVLGGISLSDIREAFRKGAHLVNTSPLDIVRPLAQDMASMPVRPVLNTYNQIVDVEVIPEAGFLPVAEPDVSHTELRNVIDAVLSTWISSTGEYIPRFEQTFAAKMDMTYGVATSNGTVSLHLALAALGIGPGDEVIVPDLTFPATINTVIHVGARPVIVDVDPHTWCMSVETIEKAITPRTRAIIPVHVFGRPAPMTEIADLAKSHGIYIIEDCAEAHGALYDGKKVGSFSNIASFSFFANKIITTGEGGICITNDPDLAQRMRILRDHGMRPERRYWHEEAGFNFRMTNLQASIGCAQLDRMEDFLQMRKTVHSHYQAALADIPGVEFASEMPPRCQPVIWFSCALTPPDKRPQLIKACQAANIDLRPFFNGLSAMPAYRRYARSCPNSAALSRSGVNLPTSRKVDARVAQKIGEIFRSVLAG